MSINQNIQKFRKELDMSQAELSDLIKVKQQTIQKYESGEIKNIPYDNILLLAKALRVSPSQLMGWEETEEVNVAMKQGKEDAELLIDYKKLTDNEKMIVKNLIKSLLENR